MKFVRRFALAASVVSIAAIMISCSSPGPTAPAQSNDSLDRGVAPTLVPPCDVRLGAAASEILNNGIPFVVSCEDMAEATMTLTRTAFNRFGCAVWVEGTVKFGDTGHSFDFEMFIKRAGAACEVDGGFILVNSPQLGYERYLRLPVSTRVNTVTNTVAN